MLTNDHGTLTQPAGSDSHTLEPFSVAFAATSLCDPAAAAKEIAEQLGPEPASLISFYANSYVDFPSLAQHIHQHCNGPTIGCTTSGEICSGLGYCSDHIVATAIRSPAFHATPLLIRNLPDFETTRINELLEPHIKSEFDFGILLIDGLSMMEEKIASALSVAFKQIPIVGGSAADSLRFEKTWVAANGIADTQAAVLTLIRTTLPYQIFQVHHFKPTDNRLVITQAIPTERRVTEINGEPAAIGYARAIGIDPARLNNEIFAQYPLMLQIQGDYFVRSILKVNPDQSLTFYCAIDEGIVLRIAQSLDFNQELKSNLNRIFTNPDKPCVILAFDCIIRREELKLSKSLDVAQNIIRDLPIIGFSTYGEQINGLHVNQTMTGVMIGGCE